MEWFLGMVVSVLLILILVCSCLRAASWADENQEESLEESIGEMHNSK